MKRIVGLLAALLLSACASVEEKPSPPAADVWEYRGTQSYEEEHPGYGVSHRYASDAGWIDVYVYDLRRSWALGVSDKEFTDHFAATIEEVKQMGERGIYGGLMVGATRDVNIAGQAFRTVAFQFERDGRRIESFTYLTARNGKLLKYRASFFAPTAQDAVAATQRFIEENLQEHDSTQGVTASAASCPTKKADCTLRIAA